MHGLNYPERKGVKRMIFAKRTQFSLRNSGSWVFGYIAQTDEHWKTLRDIGANLGEAPQLFFFFGNDDYKGQGLSVIMDACEAQAFSRSTSRHPHLHHCPRNRAELVVRSERQLGGPQGNRAKDNRV